MTSKRSFAVVIVKVIVGPLLLLAGACQPSPSPTPLPLPTTTVTVLPSLPPTALLPNLIVSIGGDVIVRRWQGKGFLPAAFGMELGPRDLLRVGAGGQATVFCGDERLWGDNPRCFEGPTQDEIPCPYPGASRVVPGLQFLRPLPPSVLIPYVIHPRKTKIMTPNPLLKWHPVGGAPSYTIIVRGKELGGQTEVTATEITYPDTAPPLLPNAYYKLIVIEEGSGHSSEEEQMPGLGFSLLSQQEVEAVRSAEAKIRELPLDENAVHFIVAHVHAAKGLHSEAIIELEELAAKMPQPAIYLVLGDLYLEVALYGEALDYYHQALSLAEARSDREFVAASEAGLGLAYYGYGNDREALKHLQEAQSLYEEIGDTERAAALSAQIVKIK